MQLKNALGNAKNSNRGVSPVIGVILMVVITVILAGVISVAVLDFGGDVNEGAPQASFDDDYDSQTLTLTHQNGDEIDASNLKLFVSGSEAKTFSGDISAGSQLTYDNGASWNGESVRLVYDDGQGNTATLYNHDAAPEYLSVNTYSTTTEFDSMLGTCWGCDTSGDTIALGPDTDTSTDKYETKTGLNGDTVTVDVGSYTGDVQIWLYDSDGNSITSKTVDTTGEITVGESVGTFDSFSISTNSMSGSNEVTVNSYTVTGP